MASPQLACLGFALILAFAALFWLAGNLRSGALLADGSRIEDPWSSASWCASEGSGSNGEDDPERPRRPLVIEDIAGRRDKIRRWLSKFNVPKAEIEDVAQEVIHSAWISSWKYDPDRGKLETWLHRITFHHASNYHDSAYIRNVDVVDPAMGPWHEIPEEDTPEDLVDSARVRQLARNLLDRIPVHLAVTLMVTAEETAVDLAMAMGKPVSTIHSWIKQGRTALARELEAEAEHSATEERKKQP